MTDPMTSPEAFPILSREEIVGHVARKLARAARAHYAVAARLRELDRMAGVVAVFGGLAILLLSLVAGLGGGFLLALCGSLGGMAATGVAVVRAAWNWGERAGRHKDWGARYANLRRRLMVAVYFEEEGYFEPIEEIAEEACRLAREADLAPETLWREAKDWREA